MSLQEFFQNFENNSFDSVKEMTTAFNELQVDERQVFLEELDETEFKSFVLS